MKWFESIVAWLFPSILVEGTPWRSMWEEKDREAFLLAAKIFFPMVALIYGLHFALYDLPNSLEPIEDWFMLRVSMTSLALATFLFYATPLNRTSWYKAPAVATCWAFCQVQALVALWHGRESWVFCYILIAVAVVPLRMSALLSAIFVIVTVGTQAPVLIQAGIPVTYIYTGSMVALLFSIIVRSSYLSEIRTFLVNQENIAAQKQIIELNIEFSDRIRSFIPRVIAERIEDYVENFRMSVIEASIEVLAAKKKDVACLFTDIRGYTQASKDLEKFVGQSVMPEVRVCSDAVEEYRGIPRKIGDLIFAYFDDPSIERNILNAAMAGMAIARLNLDMNATSSSVEIRRYVLIASGEALVGNLGGLDSSIEITALGSPVNFLSRVDELTKHPKMQGMIEPGDLIICERTKQVLAGFAETLEFRPIDVTELKIRDFPEVRCIYSLQPTDSNFSALSRAHESVREEVNGTLAKGQLFAA